MNPYVSAILPVYRNRDTLPELHSRLIHVLEAYGRPFEIIYVNDAGPDNSLQLMNEWASGDERIKVIALRDNVGQNAALLAGLAQGRGERFVTLDADLQDEPECIPAMLARLCEGYHAVFAGKYGSYESIGRRVTSLLFKMVLSLLTSGRLPVRSGLFMVLDRGLVERLLEYAIPSPHLLTLIGLSGLRLTSIPFRRPVRSGSASSYSTSMRFKVALSAWKTFMHVRRYHRPLRAAMKQSKGEIQRV